MCGPHHSYSALWLWVRLFEMTVSRKSTPYTKTFTNTKINTKTKISNRLKYETNQLLGRGAFTFIFLGTFNEHRVAVKKIYKLRWCGNVNDVNVQINLHRENVVKILEIEEDEAFGYKVSHNFHF